MKSLRQVIPMLVVLTLAVMLSGCGKNSAPTAPNSLDQAPPAAPTQIIAALDASIPNGVLEWAPSSSANVAGYEVYQYSPSPERESAYVLAAETDANTTQYPLPSNIVPMTVYYRLRSVSSTGVKSEWSALTAVTVGPPQGGGDDPEGSRVPMKKP